MSEHLGGAKIYFKRDELNHTGAHKNNNVLGQIQLALRMGKKASSPRRAPGSMALRLQRPARNTGSECVVYMARSTSSGRSQMCSA